MTEDEMKEREGEKDFKVEDRRTSSSSSGKAEKPPVSEDGSGPRGEAKPESPQPGVPGGALKVDFSTFVFSLFSSALIQLGDMADPMTGSMDPNLTAAKQTIDIVDILREKTKGNLSDEENNLLDNASAELKWKYLDAVKKKGKDP